MRRGRSLYLNDGAFGNLSELKCLPGSHPLRLIRPGGHGTPSQGGFDLYGPTCDSADAMPGSYMLPEDVREGDWIEVGLAGAYSTCLNTGFNGLGCTAVVELEDAGPQAPLLMREAA